MLGRPGPQMAVAGAPAGRRAAHRPAQPGHRRQRAGVLGEVLPLLRRRGTTGSGRGRPAAPHRRRGRAVLRREHHRCGRRPRARPSTGATSRCKEIAAALDQLRARHRSGHTRSTSTPPRAGSWRPSCSPTSNGTSGSPGCSPSTRRGTSTGWSIRGSAGSSGATRRPCRKT